MSADFAKVWKMAARWYRGALLRETANLESFEKFVRILESRYSTRYEATEALEWCGRHDVEARNALIAVGEDSFTVRWRVTYYATDSIVIAEADTLAEAVKRVKLEAEKARGCEVTREDLQP